MTTTDEDVASTDFTTALLVDSARGHIIKVSTLLLDAGADKDVAPHSFDGGVQCRSCQNRELIAGGWRMIAAEEQHLLHAMMQKLA